MIDSRVYVLLSYPRFRRALKHIGPDGHYPGCYNADGHNIFGCACLEECYHAADDLYPTSREADEVTDLALKVHLKKLAQGRSLSQSHES